MAKENNKNKTINFAEKKKAYASKQAQNKTPKTMPEGKMVYDINRMREQINQQTRNLKNKKLIKKSRPAWVVLVYLLIITAIVVLTGSKIYNAALNYRTYGTMPKKFTSIDNSLSTQDTIKYEQLIKRSFQVLSLIPDWRLSHPQSTETAKRSMPMDISHMQMKKTKYTSTPL